MRLDQGARAVGRGEAGPGEGRRREPEAVPEAEADEWEAGQWAAAVLGVTKVLARAPRSLPSLAASSAQQRWGADPAVGR
jgi:hypothetical protein